MIKTWAMIAGGLLFLGAVFIGTHYLTSAVESYPGKESAINRLTGLEWSKWRKSHFKRVASAYDWNKSTSVHIRVWLSKRPAYVAVTRDTRYQLNSINVSKSSYQFSGSIPEPWYADVWLESDRADDWQPSTMPVPFVDFGEGEPIAVTRPGSKGSESPQSVEYCNRWFRMTAYEALGSTVTKVPKIDPNQFEFQEGRVSAGTELRLPDSTEGVLIVPERSGGYAYVLSTRASR